MDRRPRPPAPRHASRLLIAGGALAFALGCAGCGTADIRISGSGAGPPAPLPGTTYRGGTVELRYPGASTAAALIAIGVLGAATYAPPGPGVPPLDERRRVQERDCTQPIEDWTANLRCR